MQQTISPEIQSYAQEAFSLLQQAIRIPAFSREESHKADFIEKFMKSRGLNVERCGNNLWCRSSVWNSALPTLMLNAHIDTVKPTGIWKYDPFGGTVVGNRLYGLGSNDCGGGWVSLLQAFRLLEKREDLPWNLLYVASAEEEVSGKNGIELLLPLLPPIDVAIVGEPTGLQPAIAEKGLMVLDVTTQGRSGHAARDEGDNAIYKALTDIEWFRTHEFEKTSPLLGRVKMSVTMIQAGTQHNVVPAECKFTVDVRSNECYTNLELLEEISKSIQSHCQPRSTRLNSSSISPEHPLVKSLLALGLQPFGSPTLSDQALLSCPSLKLGPGQSSRSHTPDEFIELEEIAQAISLYVLLLEKRSL